MNTTAPISWAITAIGSDAVISAAEGFEHTAAWTAALRVAHVALLTGELED